MQKEHLEAPAAQERQRGEIPQVLLGVLLLQE